jgi:hypothetical protein
MLLVSQAFAQELTFEEKAKEISNKIDAITTSEKAALKKDIKMIDRLFNEDKLTFEEYDAQKKEAAILHAKNIKTKIAEVETELHNLVQNKVDSKIKSIDGKGRTTISFDSNGVKIYRKRSDRSRRTHSYTVIAFGLNNLIDDGDVNSIQDSEFEFGGSRFFEFGINYKTRLFENSGLLYLDYGLSARYNSLRPKNNQFFVTDDKETFLEIHTENLKKSNFKNVQLVVPVFLEFDLSKPKIKNDRTIYRRNRGVRFGFGGFGGINLKSKQTLRYKLDGKKVKDKTRGDFNVNNFVYGLNAFIGFSDTSFYVKYDFQDLFDDNFKNQKNISFGVRFDL